MMNTTAGAAGFAGGTVQSVYPGIELICAAAGDRLMTM